MKRAPKAKKDRDGRPLGLDRNPGTVEWLEKRSAAFARATQRKGMPMTYGGKGKGEK